ncbi:hypothetical protein ACFV2E_36425 [Streptomyces globisporus]|uniref:hypothetical protein n=1 Tax=Streptomyces globisporus TaxID=1908 RepID=UPI001781FB8C|nr:hypothetical protein OG215_41505 [Streptomyces globisporus]
MEVCTCRGGVAVLDQHTETIPAPTAGGGYGDWEDRDNQRGPERDETDTDLFRQLVRQLVDDGDDRAATAGRRARRTVKEMTGQSLPPVLHMTRPLTFTPTAPAGPVAGGQCTSCGGYGGKVVDTSDGTVTRQTWHSCIPCGGTGVAR